MDTPSINATFMAHAHLEYPTRSYLPIWRVEVREHLRFTGHDNTRPFRTEIVARPHRPHYAHTGTEQEAWEPLLTEGWQRGGATATSMIHGLEMAVTPPVGAHVTSISPGEWVFVQRCAARRIPATAALDAWKAGERDLSAFVARYQLEVHISPITGLTRKEQNDRVTNRQR